MADTYHELVSSPSSWLLNCCLLAHRLRLLVTQYPSLLSPSVQHTIFIFPVVLPLGSPIPSPTTQHQLHLLTKPNHFSTPLALMSSSKQSSFLAWMTAMAF